MLDSNLMGCGMHPCSNSTLILYYFYCSLEIKINCINIAYTKVSNYYFDFK